MVKTEEQQLAMLPEVLSGMNDYLQRIVPIHDEISLSLQLGDTARGLLTLSQVLEGLTYYGKMVESTAISLHIDRLQLLTKKDSLQSYLNDFVQLVQDIGAAMENEDYSLLADLAGYALPDLIQTAQELLAVLRQIYQEKVVANGTR
jgi:hypothetical protein